MFTQCPQCEAAFRITAEVLQQARGQVRCGSCDHAFNALDHLSEEPPAITPSPADAPDGGAEVDDNGSQALLKTLDRLAGPDEFRIEDTGVEWLVVDEDDAPAEDQSPPDPDATGSLRWIIEGSEDDAAAGEAELPEVSDQVSADIDLETTATTEQLVLDEQTALQFEPQTAEPRYDDNTPLPDDFEEQHSFTPQETPQRRSTDQDQNESQIESDEPDDSQSEFELSEPDDWTDLLNEVAPVPAGAVDTAAPMAEESPGDDLASSIDDLPLEVEEELAAIHDELSAMPDAGGSKPIADPLPLEDDDLDISLDAEPEPAAEPESEIAVVASQLDDLLEAMGTNKFRTPNRIADESSETDDSALSDQILSLVEDAIDEAAEEIAADTSIEPALEPAHQTADRAEQAEPDRVDKNAGTDETPDDDAEPRKLDEADGAAEPEDSAASEESAVEIDGEMVTYEETTGEFERAIADAEGAIRAELAETDDKRESGGIDVAGEDDDPDAPDPETDAAGDAKTVKEDVAEDAGSGRENGPAEEGAAKPGKDAADDLDDELAAMTGNLKIDADLLRAMKDENLAASMTNEDGSPLVETIVMEGDFVSGAIHDAIDIDSDKEFTTEENEAKRDLQDPGSLVDTYMFNRNEERRDGSFSGKRAIVGIVVLILLLIGQFIHSSRESLATLGAFNQTLGPLYRMFGNPVTPTWNIKGWQFEATNGSTSEDNSVLTIYSRISNRAQQRLPYPLVHVSLTDRYEEIIGSRVMEPNEYLAGNADPSRPVAAGDSFTAVITVASPSPDATGFKLNVCYRVTPGRVRCAIEDFEAP